MNPETTFIKRTAFEQHVHNDSEEGHRYPSELLMREAHIMETISPKQHLYIVQYHGCRVRRGRITGLVLENLDQTLKQWARLEPDDARSKRLDKEAFLAGVASAVKFLHSLGLAHNDINPNNIMVREAEDGSCAPVLIDFNSCAPFGASLRKSGTEGLTDEDDKEPFVSQKNHDEYALRRLREWWDEDHAAEKAKIAANRRYFVTKALCPLHPEHGIMRG